jgi:predicted transcriptional regulator
MPPATLLQDSPLEKDSRAQPIGWTQRQVQDFAADAAAKLGYKPGGDIEDVVMRLGGRIEHSDWNPTRQTGYLEAYGPQNFLIALSPYASHRRSRFTIAHEIGHYALHTRLGRLASPEKPLRIDRAGGGRMEWEANWFAAGFLMPAEVFRSQRQAGLNDLQLADYFDVSVAAVAIRREVLDAT